VTVVQRRQHSFLSAICNFPRDPGFRSGVVLTLWPAGGFVGANSGQEGEAGDAES